MVIGEVSQQLRKKELQRLRDEIEKKHGKSPEELYKEREKRVRDAIELREPDRIPVMLAGGYFAAKRDGLTFAQAYYDVNAFHEAYKKMALEFEPDLSGAGAGVNSGQTYELLDVKTMRWPGYNLPPNIPHQAVEMEAMKEDEYDIFLNDPTDFMLRYYLPRVFGALEPLAKLPPLRNFAGSTFTAITPLFASPEFRQLAETLYKAGQEQEKWRQARSAFDEEMASLGFPPIGHGGGAGGAPFDAISDSLRGMRGAMLDMYRRPEKLIAACDKILQWRLARATPADPKKPGNPKRTFLPLHRGAEGFMSLSQFEKFYWPGLKEAVLASIELGYVPTLFFEGRCESRLEYLLELPKGSAVCGFVDTDMARAKAVLGGHLCITGNVPVSLLQVGSVTQVEEYCKNLIEVCGKGGGFIMTPGSSAIEGAKPENLRAMVDSVKKYGVN